MEKNPKWLAGFLKFLTYVAVAALASAVTFAVCLCKGPVTEYITQLLRPSKLEQMETAILNQFVGQADQTALQDQAAAAMVAATGDRWSYYIPAAQFQDYQNQMDNSYVGIGVTITLTEEKDGFHVDRVEPGSGAQAAGILPGDVVTAVEGQRIQDLGADTASDMVRGEEGTAVKLTLRRGEETLDLTVMRQTVQVQVAKGELLEGNVGYVTIANFDSRCAQETVAVVEALMAQGAESLLFDVRFNPGGYRSELVDLLDYLLPEGDLFRSVDYKGAETVDTSDAACIELPMAVLVNAESYSAAEFFAAALAEYDWATVVGQQTVGKGYFQNLVTFTDGSGMSLSMGKYFTPKGVSLAEVGGLTPAVEVEVTQEQAAAIYGDTLPLMEDPQILAALEVLKK